jgi:hypothetical protein
MLHVEGLMGVKAKSNSVKNVYFQTAESPRINEFLNALFVKIWRWNFNSIKKLFTPIITTFNSERQNWLKKQME